MRINKTLGIGLAVLLLMTMAIAVSSTLWDGVPDDPTPAQAIWVDPKNTTCFLGEKFVVDILVNITDPDGPGLAKGMHSFEYKLFWNSSIINLINRTTHVPAGWEPPNGILVKDEVGVWAGGPKDGLCYHWYAYVALVGTPAFTGVTSLCTYTFHAVDIDSCTIDIQDDILTDDTATKINHTTVDGYVIIVGGEPVRQCFSVTWKWLDYKKNPVWLTANVTVTSIYSMEIFNFNFNRSLGQISFNITSAPSAFCNVTVPKLLMDGAFKVLINDTFVPSKLTWNKTHTFVYFTHTQGTHNFKIIGEIVTRLRGPDLLSLSDVNGDGFVNIKDIITVAISFGWEEDG